MSEKDITEVKRDIETDLFYYVECHHCKTVFLVEESIDNGLHYSLDDENLVFKCTCPRCETETSNLSTGRLKLRVEKVMEDREPSPLILRLAEKLKIKGIDY